MLIVYGVVVAYLFGAVMNMWFWPFMLGAGSLGAQDLSYIPGGPLLENLKRFGWYTLITSTAVWDTGRAITNTVLTAFLGAPVIAILRRSVRKARFGAQGHFAPQFDLEGNPA